MALDIDFNNNLYIQKYRIINNISQRDLAKRIHISQGYLSEIERGIKSPTIRMLYKIAEELDVCPRSLIHCKIECSDCFKKYKCEVTK